MLTLYKSCLYGKIRKCRMLKPDNRISGCSNRHFQSWYGKRLNTVTSRMFFCIHEVALFMKIMRFGQAIETLGKRYRLEGMLGSGGMADVCLAWDEVEQRDVAIKLLKPDG